MTDRERIEAAVRDYFEGWFDADVGRMDRALHADLVKRSRALDQTSRARMLELTAAGEGRADRGDGTLEIDIVDVYEDIASVTVRSATYCEYVHLLRGDDGWKVTQTLWRER